MTSACKFCGATQPHAAPFGLESMLDGNLMKVQPAWVLGTDAKCCVTDAYCPAPCTLVIAPPYFCCVGFVRWAASVLRYQLSTGEGVAGK